REDATRSRSREFRRAAPRSRDGLEAIAPFVPAMEEPRLRAAALDAVDRVHGGHDAARRLLLLAERAQVHDERDLGGILVRHALAGEDAESGLGVGRVERDGEREVGSDGAEDA